MTIAAFRTHDTAALLQTWTRGWAASRACAAPIADGAGWRIEVGQPDQLRRHVFPAACDTLRERGASIRDAAIWLKACIHADEMRALLPPRWTVHAPSYFMRFDGEPPRTARWPDGYALRIEREGDVFHALVDAPDGTLASKGRIVIVDDAAIFDRIATDAAHQRRGLGRALMGALHATARDLGATRGLLAATQDGHALYTTLGWRVQAPYASAVIVG